MLDSSSVRKRGEMQVILSPVPIGAAANADLSPLAGLGNVSRAYPRASHGATFWRSFRAKTEGSQFSLLSKHALTNCYELFAKT